VGGQVHHPVQRLIDRQRPLVRERPVGPRAAKR
jgi:hypothetical protein